MKNTSASLRSGVSQQETPLEKEAGAVGFSVGRVCHTPDVTAEFLREIGTLNRHFAKMVGQICWSPSESQYRSDL